MKRKALLISLIALAMALCMFAGATIAYLFVKTNTVTNTFSPSNIGLTLLETKNNFKMVPGEEIEKDPIVTVTNDVDCYVFVKVEKSSNYGTYLADYIIAAGWNELTSAAGTNYKVYYRTVGANDTTKAFDVLAGNKVKVLTSVTKEQMEAIKTSNQPTLSFTAYAIQTAGFDTAAAAWPTARDQASN